MGNYTKNLFKRNKLKSAAPAKPEPKFAELPDAEEIAKLTPDDGKTYIKLWLDDTRSPECDPYGGKGWTWVKSYREAVDLFDTENVVVTDMSIDYYLDYHHPGTPTGDRVIEELIMRMNLLGRPDVFGSVVRANCHSSERDCRIKTANVIVAAQEEGTFCKMARVSIHQAKNADSW